MKALVVVALGLVVVPSIAIAQAFEAKAETAITSRLDDIVWTFTAACNTGDEVQQRQCRLVRDKRQKALVGAVLLVDGETAALELSKWSPQKKSLGFTVTSCISCAGVEVDGKKWFVIGNGAGPRFEGPRLRTHVLRDTALPFADEAAATAWTKPLAHARVQYLVKVPDKPKWNAGGNTGVALQILGYRVINPCDGSIVAADPASASVAADKKVCAGEEAAPTVGKQEKLPDGLTGQMIKAALQPVVDAANACFARYKTSGKAKLVMMVDAEGNVTEYVQEGEFIGTPTATCIDTAAKKVTFPRTQKAKQKIGFPIVLR
jgi:hypothetical protein